MADEMRAYDPTMRERMASALQGGMEGVGMNRSSARKHAQTIMGGANSGLPLGVGIADFAPFIGTSMGIEEGARDLGDAYDAVKRGDYLEAAGDTLGAAMGLIPGARSTFKASKNMLKKLKTIDLPPLKLIETDSVPKKKGQSLKEWSMAGGGVPAQYKGREDVWHKKAERFAAGGAVFNTEPDVADRGDIMQGPAYGGGGAVKKAVKDAVEGVKPLVDRINMHFKDVTKRVPELQEGAQKVQGNEMTRAEYEKLVKKYKPVKPYEFVPKPATRDDAINALTADKRDLYGTPSGMLQAGDPVGLRLDIPAYSDHGVWVPAVHRQAAGFGAGDRVGYESVAGVMNPTFGMSEKAALSIAAGKPKGTIATIKGEWNPMDEATAVARAQEYLDNPDWAQVGMDPERHGYFYDRRTMKPITAAEEAIQIGPLVLAKKPQYGNKKDFKHAGGGAVKEGVKGLLKGVQKILSPAESNANLVKFLEPSKAPMRLYHGTTATEGGKGAEAIRRIKPSKDGSLGSGVYLTPKPTYAGSYAEETGGNVLPVHAQIRNPLIIEGTHGDPMVEALTKLGMAEDKASRMVERAYENKGYIGKEVESRARAAGYDGLMQYRDGDLSEVVSYNPNAVKSSIGNRGTYDVNEPDLSKADGGAVHMAGGGKVKDAVKSGLKKLFGVADEAPAGVEPIVVKDKPAKAAKPANYSPKVLESTAARFADSIAAANPKMPAEEVSKKAMNQATKKLEWERTQKPELVKRYGDLVKASYADSNLKKQQNTPQVVQERMRKANEFLDQPTEPWTPPKPELQAFDRSSIKDALEGFPDVEQSKFPRDIPSRANIEHVEGLYTDPANRALIEKQIKRGLPLGGETFYASLYPVKQAVLEAGMPAKKFDQWIHGLAPASARNSIMNEMASGQLLRSMHARGIPLTEENVAKEMALFKEKFGIGLPLMPLHREGVAKVLEGGQNLRDMSLANIPTNYKIPTYGSQKAGDFANSVVLDVHEAGGQTQGSRFHPYFNEQGGFGNTEYNAGEQGMLGIAQDLGIPGGMAQAGRWFGGGELTGLRSPRGDALDLLEKQVAYTLQQKGVQPNPANVRAEVLKQIKTGEGDLLPWYRGEGMPDVRQTGLQRAEGGEVHKADGGLIQYQNFAGGGAAKKFFKDIADKVSGKKPDVSPRAYATPEYIPGRGVGHLEGLIDDSFDARKNFSEQASAAFKDTQGRDVLHGALGLNPIPTRSMTGAFRPSGEIPFAGGRLGGPSVSGRLPMETQPGFALGNDIAINNRKSVPKSTKNKLTAAEAVRGGMTGQHGSPWNIQIPSRKGESLFVDLEGRVDPERMGLSAALQDGEGALADTGFGTAMINWGNKPSLKEAKVIADRLGGTGVTPTKNISDYVDYSNEWMQPQGSGAVARKMLGYADELSPIDYQAVSEATRVPAGVLHDLYETASRTRDEATRADLMNMLRTLRDKGLPGITAGLAAGEAFPAEQSKKSGGLAYLRYGPGHG